MSLPPTTSAAPAAARLLAPATVAVTAGRPPRVADNPLNTPLVPASTYHAGGDTGYGRFGNPTWAALEEVVGALEGGEAVAFSSGMAGVAAVLSLVPAGGIVVAPRHSYSGTLALLQDQAERGRLAVRLVDIADTAAVGTAAAGAHLVWIESPTNPALEVADIPALVAGGNGALVAVDNTFATPVLQRPREQGAHLVVHSATKYLAGHSDALLGVVVADAPVAARLREQRTAAGAVPGVLEAFLALRGIRTLHLRVERAQANAAELVRRLTGHPGVERLRYPGFGGIVAIEVAGGPDAADAVAGAVQLWVHATSLGGVESTLERRRRWAAEPASIPGNLVRLAVGVEDVEDLWADLDAALQTVAGTVPPAPT